MLDRVLNAIRQQYYSKLCDRLILEYEESSSKTARPGYKKSDGIIAHEVVEAYLERALRK